MPQLEMKFGATPFVTIGVCCETAVMQTLSVPVPRGDYFDVTQWQVSRLAPCNPALCTKLATYATWVGLPDPRCCMVTRQASRLAGKPPYIGKVGLTQTTLYPTMFPHCHLTGPSGTHLPFSLPVPYPSARVSRETTVAGGNRI